jgi:hypothetical protein
MNELLAELAEQHRVLRGMLARCEELLAGGDPDPAVLVREVAKLRITFGAHNEFEEQLLRPAFAERDAFAAARLERMIAEHVEEHRTLRTRLDATTASALGDALETIRVHLDAEERYLFVP